MFDDTSMPSDSFRADPDLVVIITTPFEAIEP